MTFVPLSERMHQHQRNDRANYCARCGWPLRYHNGGMECPTFETVQDHQRKNAMVRLSHKGELCAEGPPRERRASYRLQFADPDKGFALYHDRDEAIDAYLRAKDNWTCELYETVRI